MQSEALKKIPLKLNEFKAVIYKLQTRIQNTTIPMYFLENSEDEDIFY